MTSKEIRQKFLNFFEKHGHTIVPSSSLIPDDPSVLLTSAGMQQFKSYYMGASDPLTSIHSSLGKPLGSKNVLSIQKCFRTVDIEEVGDESHLTFLEMLGNFSFGGYFKKAAIEYAYEFITQELKLEISYVTVLGAEDFGLFDKESKTIWNELGIMDVRDDTMENVFWGPTGSNGPCGPSTEVYCKNAAGNDIEIWNIVFNEYFYPGSREELLSGESPKKLEKLKTPGVDTGMGLERLVMIVQKKANIFETDIFVPYIELLPNTLQNKQKCIVVDHIRASVFLLADGVRPSNKEAGYLLRRLLRRIFVYGYQSQIPEHIFTTLAHDMVHEYQEFYPEFLKSGEMIAREIKAEYDKFMKTLSKGMKELQKVELMSGKIAFDLYQSFGLSPEITKEFKPFDLREFEEAKKIHDSVSGAGAEKKFGGHGLILDTGELKAANSEELIIVTRYHTATHLLQSAIRKVLGDEVHQMGSDITSERMRFDFNFERKLTLEEIQKIERSVNFAIQQHYKVEMREMSYDDAIKLGVLQYFKEKYPPIVKVYSIGNLDATPQEICSRELCGGPHVKNTAEIGHFTIIKEEAIGRGIRRIRATINTELT